MKIDQKPMMSDKEIKIIDNLLTEGEKPVKEGGYAHRGLALFQR